MKFFEVLGFFVLSTIFILIGIYMSMNNIAIIGTKRNLELNVVGGSSIIFVGLIFLYVSYHSLSPFSKFRSFFEENNFFKRKRQK
jgi:NhaP-type Na+/H+ or K+/H+ antiporter